MPGIHFKSLKVKMIAAFLAASLIPVTVVGTIAYVVGEGIIKKQVFGDFQAIGESKEQALASYLREKKSRVDAFSKDRFIMDDMLKIDQKAADSAGSIQELAKYVIEDKMRVDNQIAAIDILTPEGKVLVSSDALSIGADKSQDDYFTGAKAGPYMKDIYISPVTKAPAIAFSAPIKDKKTGEFLGVIVNHYGIGRLNEIIGDKTGLGDTGEAYIVNRDGYIVTESRFREGVVLKEKIDTKPVKLFQSQKKEMVGMYPDYRGQMVLGASMGKELEQALGLGWVVITEVDEHEAFAGLNKLIKTIALVSILASILVFALSLKVAAQIANPIKLLSDAAAEVGNGDLTKTISIKSEDEIGRLARSFNDMVNNLKEVLSKTQDAVSNITASSQEILAASQEQAAAAREQSSAVAETSTAAKELSVSAEEVGKSIRRVAESSSHALVGMAKIKESIAKTNQLINALGDKSQKIGKITDLIDDVADQTNLLAVNASIEAARAGEQGRGFTVVADEIRKLSDSTAKSTKDITALIELIQHEMTNSLMSMEQSVSSVDQEARLAQETADNAKEIAMSVSQQISGSKQIADAMLNIDEAMKQVTAGAQQTQVAVKQLTGLAQELKELTGKFMLVSK